MRIVISAPITNISKPAVVDKRGGSFSVFEDVKDPHFQEHIRCQFLFSSIVMCDYRLMQVYGQLLLFKLIPFPVGMCIFPEQVCVHVCGQISIYDQVSVRHSRW